MDFDTLRVYYQRFFPYQDIFLWLNHDRTPQTDFLDREIAFTIENAYVRYQSYMSADAFKADVLRLMPTRFEYGPVYSANPRQRKMLPKGACVPVKKEFCLDIDLSDYNSVRTCCTDTAVCNKCWKFATIAIEILDVALREDFGFQNLLWVFSGRRGVHCWVSDAAALALDEAQRSSIAAYLQVLGTSTQGKLVNLPRPFHPHIARSFAILKSHFKQIVLEEQDPWRTAEQAEELLKRIQPADLVARLRSKWASKEISSAQRWADIDTETRQLPVSSGSRNSVGDVVLAAKQDIVFEYLYPRLDAAVSRGLNHLLKSPFVVHPSTGKICVALDLKKLDKFDIDAVPRYDVIVKELDATNDITKTSLKDYTEYFRHYVQETLPKKRAADTLDF